MEKKIVMEQLNEKQIIDSLNQVETKSVVAMECKEKN